MSAQRTSHNTPITRVWLVLSSMAPKIGSDIVVESVEKNGFPKQSGKLADPYSRAKEGSQVHLVRNNQGFRPGFHSSTTSAVMAIRVAPRRPSNERVCATKMPSADPCYWWAEAMLIKSSPSRGTAGLVRPASKNTKTINPAPSENRPWTILFRRDSLASVMNTTDR